MSLLLFHSTQTRHHTIASPSVTYIPVHVRPHPKAQRLCYRHLVNRNTHAH